MSFWKHLPLKLASSSYDETLKILKKCVANSDWILSIVCFELAISEKQSLDLENKALTAANGKCFQSLC